VGVECGEHVDDEWCDDGDGDDWDIDDGESNGHGNRDSGDGEQPE
jgi:hypothetical protein